MTGDVSQWVHTVSLADLLSLPRSQVGGKHAHKDVLRVFDESAEATTSLYVKRQWAWNRRWPRWSDWREGVSRTPDPVREHDGLARMYAAGFSVPQPLRLLRDPLANSPRAAVIVSAVPVERSLAQWLRQGDVARLDPFARRGLVVALAEMSDRLSHCGLRWRSMKAKHIYPQQITDNRWRLWLIDCEGVHPRASQRQHNRDRRLLLRSMHAGGADAALLTAVESALIKRRGRATSRSRAASTPPASPAIAAAIGR